jgi:type I restriction enzyme S subunit
MNNYQLSIKKYPSYKDSTIEQLGEVPEHWEVKRLKDLSKLIIDGTHFTPTYTNDGINFLSVNDITRKPFDLEKSKFISRDAHNDLIRRCYPKKGDILLSKNGTIGIPFLIDFDNEISIYVSLCLIKILPKINTKYSYYSFLASFMFEQYNLHSKTNSVSNLHLDKLRNFFQLYPPLSEQKTIATYLDTKTAQIDQIIQNINTQIEKLKELRKTLINDVVTGKIRVTEPQ